MRCSPLFVHNKAHHDDVRVSYGAGKGNRTPIPSLGSWCSAIELYLREIIIAYKRSEKKPEEMTERLSRLR